jgi:hypothetical protein
MNPKKTYDNPRDPKKKIIDASPMKTDSKKLPSKDLSSKSTKSEKNSKHTPNNNFQPGS